MNPENQSLTSDVETKSTQSDSERNEKGPVKWFFAWCKEHMNFCFYGIFVFLCTLISWGILIRSHAKFTDDCALILENYRWINSGECDSDVCHMRIDSLILSFSGLTLDEKLTASKITEAIVDESVKLIIQQVGNRTIADFRHAEIERDTKHLLELEFAKIQREYVSIEIWFGILTVVFLIFSFYSLFKADDLVKQQKESLKEFKERQREAKDNVAEILDKTERDIRTMKEEGERSLDDMKVTGRAQMRRIKEDFDVEKATFQKEHNEWRTEGAKIMDGMKKLYDDFHADLDEAIGKARQAIEANVKSSSINVDAVKVEYDTIKAQVDNLRGMLEDMERRTEVLKQAKKEESNE